MLYESVAQLVGNTPLLHLTIMGKELPANLYAKLESWNPAGSVKDRAALFMIEDAERRGLLKPDSVIIEPTSGNTGIGLACVATARGYRTIIVMPDSMSVERQLLMAAYGAQVVLTPGSLGMQGAVEKARELAAEYPHSLIPDQFANPANPHAHIQTTGPEIWKDLAGNVDIFVAGVGTGGTISGVGRYLKQQNPRVQIVAVEPAASPLLSCGNTGKHGIMGIGANFVPVNFDRTVVDQILTVTEEQAYAAARELGRTEGILAGISSGAALHGALTLAKMPENNGKNIVVLFPDSAERYLSTPLFMQG